MLGPGEAVFLGRGTRHGFESVGPTPCRASIVCTPSGLERFFREIGSLEPARAAPPPALLEAAAVRAGLEFFL